MAERRRGVFVRLGLAALTLALAVTILWAMLSRGALSSSSPSVWDWLLPIGLLALSIIEITNDVLIILDRRTKRRTDQMWQDGYCIKCGYDLKGCSGIRCPECGAWHGGRRARRRD